MFKSKKEVAKNTKVEKLSKEVLKNVIGGDGGATTDPTVDTKGGGTKGQVATTWDLFKNTK